MLNIKIDPRQCSTQTWVISLARLPETHTPQNSSATPEEEHQHGLRERASCSEIRDVVTTIVRNHVNAVTPMDVDIHIMSIEKEKLQGESGEYAEQSDENDVCEQHRHQYEEGRPFVLYGKERRRRMANQWQAKDHRKIGRSNATTAGKMGHGSRDCSSGRSTGKGEQKGKGAHAKSEHGYKGGYHHYKQRLQGRRQVRERVRFTIICSLTRSPCIRLVTTSRNGYSGNVGGIGNF